MSTLRDLLNDFANDVRENDQLPFEDQKDPGLIVDEYIDIICRRIVGKEESGSN